MCVCITKFVGLMPQIPTISLFWASHYLNNLNLHIMLSTSKHRDFFRIKNYLLHNEQQRHSLALADIILSYVTKNGNTFKTFIYAASYHFQQTKIY